MWKVVAEVRIVSREERREGRESASVARVVTSLTSFLYMRTQISNWQDIRFNRQKSHSLDLILLRLQLLGSSTLTLIPKPLIGSLSLLLDDLPFMLLTRLAKSNILDQIANFVNVGLENITSFLSLKFASFRCLGFTKSVQVTFKGNSQQNGIEKDRKCRSKKKQKNSPLPRLSLFLIRHATPLTTSSLDFELDGRIGALEIILSHQFFQLGFGSSFILLGNIPERVLHFGSIGVIRSGS